MPEHRPMCAGAPPQPTQAGKLQGKALAKAPAAPDLVTGPPAESKDPRTAAAQGSQPTINRWSKRQGLGDGSFRTQAGAFVSSGSPCTAQPRLMSENARSVQAVIILRCLPHSGMHQQLKTLLALSWRLLQHGQP